MAIIQMRFFTWPVESRGARSIKAGMTVRIVVW